MCTKKRDLTISDTLLELPLESSSQLFQNLLFYSLFQSTEKDHQILDLLLSLAFSNRVDHIGGGFFNPQHSLNQDTIDYSKSLSENAQMLKLFTDASGHFFDGNFSVPAINSAQWIIDHLQGETGAFYQAVESGNSSNYYHLEYKQIKNYLDKDAFIAFASAFDLNIDKPITRLCRARTYQQIAEHTGMHIKQVPLALESGRQQLQLVRQLKPTPPIKQKVHGGNNSKIISALFNAARQFNRDDFATAALSALGAIRPIQPVSASDHLLLIDALLTKLQYQWHDPDYQWLLQTAFGLMSDFGQADVVLAITEADLDSALANLTSLYALSSNSDLLALLENVDANPQANPSWINHFSTQHTIIIRGSKYESAYWHQQLATGFKPNNHVFAIPNNCSGPDGNKFPKADSPQATSCGLNVQQNYYSLDKLLNDFA